MAHHEHVGRHGLQILQGVEQGFALAGRGGGNVQVEHVRREPLGGQLKGGAGARGVLEEHVADRLTAQQRNLLDGALAHFEEGVGGVEQFGQQFARQPFNGQEVAQLALLVELQVVRRQAHGDLNWWRRSESVAGGLGRTILPAGPQAGPDWRQGCRRGSAADGRRRRSAWRTSPRPGGHSRKAR